MKRGADFAFFLLLVLAVVVGSFLRLTGLAAQPLFGDEFHTFSEVERSYGEILSRFGRWGSQAALPVLQKLCLEVFGPGVVSFRLPALVPGLLTLLVTYRIARPLVGRGAAVVATWALALGPIVVYYSRFSRSYALAVLLGLLLVHALRTAVATSGGRGKVAWGAAVLVGGLLPWVHMSTASFVLAAFLASAAITWRRAKHARSLLAPGVSLAGAGILALLLLAPAWSEVIAFLDRVAKTTGEPGETGLLDVLTLLAGGYGAAIASLVLLPVAMVLTWREDREAAIWLGAAVLGPLAGFLAMQPYGMAYALARYFLLALPFAFMLAARLAIRIGKHALGVTPRGEAAGAALGLGILALSFFLGPLGPGHGERGPFGNSYLAMRALPAFDEPFASASGFYQTLAEIPGPAGVIEVPLLRNRAVLLYRNHWRTHGRPTRFGATWQDLETLREGLGTPRQDPGILGKEPYVWIHDPELGRGPGIEFLVLHRDVRTEAEAYWSFVYETAWPRVERSRDESFMARQSKYAAPGSPPPQLEGLLRELHGEPCWVDDQVVVWKLGG